MNPEKKIQIRVNTDVLRDLLDQNPEAKLELEAFAAEKIAEELVRKFIGRKESEIAVLVREKLDSVVYSPLRGGAVASDFAKQVIAGEVDSALARAVAMRGQVLSDRVAACAEEKILARLDKIVVQERDKREAFQTQIQKWWDQARENMREEIKKLARDEFMKVIAEVSGHFTPKKGSTDGQDEG